MAKKKNPTGPTTGPPKNLRHRKLTPGEQLFLDVCMRWPALPEDEWVRFRDLMLERFAQEVPPEPKAGRPRDLVRVKTIIREVWKGNKHAAIAVRHRVSERTVARLAAEEKARWAPLFQIAVVAAKNST